MSNRSSTTTETKPDLLNKSEQFFFDNAGYSYDPKTETQEQGRERCARALARAEAWALENDYSFEWSVDPFSNSSDFRDDCPPYALWECAMRDEKGRLVQSIGGVDFGLGEPWGDPYRRVSEAELALEQFAEVEL